ncbi:MAG: hypothetical protein Q7S52_00585, partial [bacterium]|nr:hypothetical protein [bacterium]
MTTIAFFFFTVATAIILYETGRILYLARQARVLARKTKLVDYDHPSPVYSILVTGDSVGCGTGASHPDYSIAGRLAQRFSGVELTNKSVV